MAMIITVAVITDMARIAAPVNFDE